VAKSAKEKCLVLYIDESAHDCLRIQMAVGGSEGVQPVRNLSDPEQLLASLQDTSNETDPVNFTMSDLLDLDVSNRDKPGFEVLNWLQTQPFQNVLVMVLASSEWRRHH
jgi:hypothetical protein